MPLLQRGVGSGGVSIVRGSMGPAELLPRGNGRPWSTAFGRRSPCLTYASAPPRNIPAVLMSSSAIDQTDAVVEQILRRYDTITVVGASNAGHKAAHYVPEHMQSYGWRIIPVNPRATEILGEPVYPTLADVPEQVGFVDVFRPSAATPDIARQAVAAGASALWLQLGIASSEARDIAEAAGLLYVENRCLIIEQRRLRLDAPRS